MNFIYVLRDKKFKKIVFSFVSQDDIDKVLLNFKRSMINGSENIRLYKGCELGVLKGFDDSYDFVGDVVLKIDSVIDLDKELESLFTDNEDN